MFHLKPIGYVRSSLTLREHSPKQGFEGAPESWLCFDAEFRPALSHIKAGDEVLLLTWLHQADRQTLQVHPRDNREAPLTGVFSTRSQDRPNPIGVHRIRVLEIVSATELKVANLEAFDGTPIVDVKAVLDRRDEC